MSTMTTAAPGAVRYLSAVEHELGDLPADERSALLEDLALHLEALAEEDDDRPLEVRLGRPTDYAAELRAAAGLPPRGRSTAGSLSGARAAVERLAATPAAREVRAFVPQLQPAWWVLRGYLAVAVLSLLEVDGSRDFPVPAPWGSSALGVLLVALAVVGSVALGRRRLPWFGRLSVLFLEAVLVLLSLQLLTSAPDRLQDVVLTSTGPSVTQEQPLLSLYGPVTDVFPYAADGTPLEGVLLFDQDGRPLRVGTQQWWADGCVRVLEHPRAFDGVRVPFSYPQAYVLDPAERSAADGGPCRAELDRPDVPLPTFPAPAAAPAAGIAPAS